MLYITLLATFSAVFGMQVCTYYRQCYSSTLSANTVACVYPYACESATITATILDCSTPWSCYDIDASVTDTVSCGGFNACYMSDIEVSVDDSSDAGVIYCTSTSGAACQISTLTSDTVICDGSQDACAGSTISTNNLGCALEGSCLSTTVSLTGDSDYSTITLGGTRAAQYATLTQDDGDSSSSYNTLDVFLNEGYSAQNADIYSGDYNYMNIFYNDVYSGFGSTFYCEAYATCTFYCTNYYNCINSIAYIDYTATFTIGGYYYPTIYYYSSSSDKKSQKTQLKSKEKQQEYKTKLISNIQKPSENELKNNNLINKGETMEETKTLYNEKKEKKIEFINQMKTKLAKNSRKAFNDNKFNNLYYLVFAVILVVGMLMGYVLARIFPKSNKGEYQVLVQSNSQYV